MASPRSRARARHAALARALAALAATTATGACASLVGVDGDWGERPGATTTTTIAAGGAGGASATGGSGGATSSADAGAGAGGGGGGGGAGGALPDAGCVEGLACYDGPKGTEDVGTCHGGTTKCVGGAATCDGQVVPSTDVVVYEGTHLDSSCDGIPDATGVMRWLAVAGVPDGSIGTTDASAGAVDFTPEGDVVVVGTTAGPCAFGASPVSTTDAFTAWLRGGDGSIAATAAPPGQKGGVRQEGRAVAVHPTTGEIATVGLFGGPVEFSPTLALGLPAGGLGAYVTWTAAGATAPAQARVVDTWQDGIGSSRVGGVAVDAAGRTFVAVSEFRGTDWRIRVVAHGPGPGRDVLWTRDILWGSVDAGAPGFFVNAIAVDAAHVWVGGATHGATDFGDGRVIVSAGQSDGFVLVLAKPTGETENVIAIGGAQGDAVTALAPAPNGRVAVGGWASRTPDCVVGDASIGSKLDPTGEDGFVAIVDATGHAHATTVIDGEAMQAVTAVAVHPSGRVVVGGDFYTMAKIGDHVLTGTTASFVAMADPTLTTFDYALQMGGSPLYQAEVDDVAVHAPSGAVVVGGRFYGQFYLETQDSYLGKPLPAAPGAGWAAWVMTLWP
jgi:hypothetical protein